MLAKKTMKPGLVTNSIAIACMLFFTVACSRDSSPAQTIVESFLDAHYVTIDLVKSKEFTVGLAASKIDNQIRLTQGQSIDASTRMPRVHYKLLNKKENDKRASFVYEGTIQTDDGESFTRKWLISARTDGNQWRVSNFTESE